MLRTQVELAQKRIIKIMAVAKTDQKKIRKRSDPFSQLPFFVGFERRWSMKNGTTEYWNCNY